LFIVFVVVFCFISYYNNCLFAVFFSYFAFLLAEKEKIEEEKTFKISNLIFYFCLEFLKNQQQQQKR
jgi:hypothetical protein